MTPLTPEDLARVRSMVSSNWTSIGISTFGHEAVASAYPEVQNLIMSGIITAQAAESLDPIADAYVFGFMRRRLEQTGIDIENITLEEFHEILQNDPIPLSNAERAAISYAKKWGGQYVRTIAERAAGRTISRLAAVDTDSVVAAYDKELIGDAVSRSLENRWSPDSLAAMLRRETEEDVRDWDRVAITEIQNAHENGVADDIQESFGDDSLVAKLVNPDACEFCKKLYTDDDGNPRIFKLKTLRANGDNVGRKKNQWRAVVGVIHPSCHCVLIYIPQGFKFNTEGELVPSKST